MGWVTPLGHYHPWVLAPGVDSSHAAAPPYEAGDGLGSSYPLLFGLGWLAAHIFPVNHSHAVVFAMAWEAPTLADWSRGLIPVMLALGCVSSYRGGCLQWARGGGGGGGGGGITSFGACLGACTL